MTSPAEVRVSTGSAAKLHLKDKQISPRNELFSTVYFDFSF